MGRPAKTLSCLPGQADRSAENDETTPCSQCDCQAFIGAGEARFCSNCGHSKEEHGPPVCPSCGEPMAAAFRFCGACGKALATVPAVPQPEERETVVAAQGWNLSASADGVGEPSVPRGGIWRQPPRPLLLGFGFILVLGIGALVLALSSSWAISEHEQYRFR